MTLYLHQQPGNGIGIKRVHLCRRLAGYLAAIFQFPCWTGGVLPDQLVIAIAELRFRPLQSPTKSVAPRGLASIDLRTRGMPEQDHLSATCNPHPIRNLRPTS